MNVLMTVIRLGILQHVVREINADHFTCSLLHTVLGKLSAPTSEVEYTQSPVSIFSRIPIMDKRGIGCQLFV